MTSPKTWECDHEPRVAPLQVAVAKTAERLQNNLLNPTKRVEEASARHALARLRSHLSGSLAMSPLAIEDVLMTLCPRLEERALGKGDAPSPSEHAAFQALTMFALHMQGATTPAHTEERSFARACGVLTARLESDSIKPRFDALQLSRDERVQRIHLRSMITLLRGEKISFDYGKLAVDLRNLAYADRNRDVLTTWGREFAFGAIYPTTSTQKGNN
ncbi:type I-E CRISPR-associated protein Cse2/CasB [Corynebacterium uberis]|uniref:type I-E CRISPR-associated protein Cse2/CasB n=1 Tax=Corynebacterium TaxID=1716 RepID=UPI001D0AD6DF|nr:MULTISPECIES: type I-E CRISPR-associated protein Cse2/CasB [Corynebacterium]MCZ9308321.1 type I-E CRISPR-associated protein Cse2/CasB [Corynebacterium sp. c6VSa_13]UDL73995.1 type I-E CRISPR-associated protein Cse2/CasB [Corynebacterium uberis]UDL75121.1 type I-E CRISPR-associated protein Cse2/CasB [Corynebacterium uberis]UDL77334.1 type I-E CRISPR-associated protein Cse2/CasB [Corynebacterium uberis]UDL79618.1 type I-E CRISPR-associated protein Cse2/CasB [Corynebacterium uberis]